MKNIVILGAGTWGIALAKTLALAGNKVTVWSALKNEVEQLNNSYKHTKLPGIDIPRSVVFTDDLEALKRCEYIIVAVPSVYVRSTVVKICPYISGQIIISVAKGIEKDTLMTMTEVIENELGKVNVVALSGPTHAEEVALEMPTTIVAAASDLSIANKVVSLFEDTCLRVYTNIDIRGVELCGALKNIIALASGIASGLGYGDNIKAALITRGISEIRRLGIEMGCLEQTFSGLAGIGDLIVTSTSIHSRNFKCGYLIGQGYTVDDAINKVGMVVEGINALPAAISLSALHNVEMPITSAMNSIVAGVNVNSVVKSLLLRPKKEEFDKSSTQLIYESKIIEKQRNQTMKRVITYGTFDLLHYGHINLLKRAKALGDYLIVCLSTDEFNWNEKHKKCYFTYEQRKALLEALRFVDLVIPEENWNQKKTDMHEYHIDTFVIGDDWQGKFDFLKEEGVEVVYLPRTPEISSSKMKQDLNRGENTGESKISHDEINTNPNTGNI